MSDYSTKDVRDDADDQRFARLAIEEFGPFPAETNEQGGNNGSFPAKRDLFARPAPMGQRRIEVGMQIALWREWRS